MPELTNQISFEKGHVTFWPVLMANTASQIAPGLVVAQTSVGQISNERFEDELPVPMLRDSELATLVDGAGDRVAAATSGLRFEDL